MSRKSGFIGVGEEDDQRKVPLLGRRSLGTHDASPGLTTKDVHGELASAWKRMKIPLSLLFVVFLASLGLLVAGCVVYSSAATHAQSLRDGLNAAITAFTDKDTGGYVLLEDTAFWYNINGGSSVVMNTTADPYHDKVMRVQFAQEYKTLVYKGEMPWTEVTVPDWNNDQAVDIILELTTSFDNGVPQNISLSIPVWELVQTPLGSLPYQREACTRDGGFSDVQNLKCTKYYAMNVLCTKLINRDGSWEVDNDYGGAGCFYPFDMLGGYTLVPYTGNTTKKAYFEAMAGQSLAFWVRSGDDPYIALQQLSKGTLSFASMHEEFSDRGKYLVGIGAILMFICTAVGTVLFFVRRAVKRSRYMSRLKSADIVIYSRPPVFRYLGFAVAFLGVTIGVALPMLHHWSNEYYWVWSPFLALWLVLICTPIGVVSMITFWGHVLKTRWPTRVKFALSITSSLVILTLCAISIWYMIMPGYYVFGNEPGQLDPMFVLFGVVFCLSMIPFSLLNLLACYRSAKGVRKQDDGYNMLSSSGEEMHTRRRSTNMQKNRLTGMGYGMVIVGCLVLAVAMVATSLLPPIWNMILVGTYNVFNSPYSLIQDTNPPASMFTFIPKLYLDVVVFYGFLAFIIFICALSAIVVSVHRFLNMWLRIKTRFVEINTCVGEILLLVLFTGLTAWWIWFWIFYYGRIAEIPSKYERVARGLGHLTNLFSSLLLFPVTRNSMWVQLVGIPFERAVQYHRWLGVLTVAAVTSHMITFWFDWAFTYKSLIHNIFSLQNVPHPDNWSPPMMILMWVGLIFMAFFSLNYFRRRKFELFYYTHHFFLVFFMTGLIHAWSLWYFLCGGLTLWFVDRLIRFWRGTKAFSVISLQTINKGETTEVCIQQNHFKYRAGQYAFINIPSIAPLEWHPFTISSSPGDDTITFHIKNMGKGTWTGRLNQLCEASNSDEGLLIHTSRLPVVNIDGPYGAPPQFKTSSVVLVAGGIGITPVLSIFKDFYQTHQTKIGSRNNAVQHITLIWVVRASESLEMFRDLFNTISNDNEARHKFDIILYVTGSVYYYEEPEKDDVPTRKVLMRPIPKNGRPNIKAELQSIVSKSSGKVGVMVCGPPPLVSEVRNACYTYKLELHEETFEL